MAQGLAQVSALLTNSQGDILMHFTSLNSCPGSELNIPLEMDHVIYGVDLQVFSSCNAACFDHAISMTANILDFSFFKIALQWRLIRMEQEGTF